MSCKRLFVFGAGASADLSWQSRGRVDSGGFPLAGQITERIIQYPFPWPNQKLRRDFGIQEPVEWIKNNGLAEDHFEKVYTKLAEHEMSLIRANPSQELVLCYCKDFIHVLHDIFYQVKNRKRYISADHLHFASSIISPTDEIISFNYDLELETALLMSKNKKIFWHWSDGYGTDFIPCNWSHQASSQQKAVKSPHRPSNVIVWKPHGSLNFIECRDGISQPGEPYYRLFVVNETIKLLDMPNPNDVDSCGRVPLVKEKKPGEPVAMMQEHEVTTASPVVIDPSQKKSMNQYSLTRQFWEGAKKAIAQANRIYLIGFSLNAADEHILELFRTPSDFKKSRAKVEIINKSQQDIDRIEKTLKNIGWRKILPIPVSFREWVDRF